MIIIISKINILYYVWIKLTNYNYCIDYVNEPVGCLEIWDKNCSVINHKLLKKKTHSYTHCMESRVYIHKHLHVIREMYDCYPVFKCDLPFCLGFSWDCFINLLSQVIIGINAIQKVSSKRNTYTSKYKHWWESEQCCTVCLFISSQAEVKILYMTIKERINWGLLYWTL